MSEVVSRKLEYVKNYLNDQEKSIVVFWWQVLENRDQLARDIESWEIGAFAVAHVLRHNLFRSPNSLQSDIARVIDSCRSRFESTYNSADRIAVFIISKEPFSLPETSSPADLPSWLPFYGGMCKIVPIVDLTWVADCPLNSPESHGAEISTLLYDLEGLFLDLMQSQHAIDKNSGNALLSKVQELRASDKKSKLPTSFKLEEYVAIAKGNHDKLSRIGFRPTASSLESLLGLVLRLCSASSPENIHKVGDALCAAIGLDEKIVAPWSKTSALLSVLLRPTNSQGDGIKAYSRSLLLTVYSSAQLNTAGAHADQYPMFSKSLVEGVARNLVECLKISLSQLGDLRDQRRQDATPMR